MSSPMKDRPAVYIAGPHSFSPTNGVRAAAHAADRIWAAGGSPYVPHLCHLWDLISPQPYSVWLERDSYWLARCDVLLRLPGESPGADEEVNFAHENKIPAYYGVTACLGFLREHAAGIAAKHHELCCAICEGCRSGWPVQRAIPSGTGWIHFRPEEEECQDKSPLTWEWCRAGLLHDYRGKLMAAGKETSP